MSAPPLAHTNRPAPPTERTPEAEHSDKSARDEMKRRDLFAIIGGYGRTGEERAGRDERRGEACAGRRTRLRRRPRTLRGILRDCAPGRARGDGGRASREFDHRKAL